MIRNYLFIVVLGAICGYASLYGGRDARRAALVCILATLLTHFAVQPDATRYKSVELGVFAVDFATFTGFTLVALASSRFWPLWLAGLQLTSGVSHLARALDGQLFPRAYAAATAFWSYPILLILLIGTWRHVRRPTQPIPEES